ncbi:hypothetical protein M413DRAFT_18262 [Hebeloma cylindrosporum]|uniref:RGS domain-containing protein n=1 Tax=Hebeloma cylindrosporum TaxID=76867 RepID=A0A0C3CHS1_HEBCY|nr:hypothetical protein M413DRAFT_18262 [Hebeloma cylindrosporum h7]
MASRRQEKFTQTQPRTYQLSLKALLSFPFRLCNPPPAVGKVRSCAVTPLYDVRLEDVLERRHLPPLGLKDFEEWLLFVEMSPENLYFTLWLREYKQRYNQWKSQSAFQSRNTSANDPLPWFAQHSSHLAMFYARAKQTFLTPGSEYELNLTTTLLAPFHTPDLPPHPDPELFREIEHETYRMLRESLRRFVQAQFNNVGNNRVMCGIVAGIFFTLVGALVPLIINFARGDSRWSRLAAFPGLWFGLTVLFASLNGICLGVYFFGDLRQLRKFELSRPPISKPQPLPPYKRPSLSTRPVSMTNSILPMQNPRQSVTIHPSRLGPPAPLTRIPSGSSSATRTTMTSSQVTSTDDGIHISPAYYDADEIDDDVIYSYAYDSDRDAGFPLDKQDERNNADPLDPTTVTAAFIRPFEMADEEDMERSLHLPSRHQPMMPFDFDSLPALPNFKATTPRPSPLELKDLIAQQVPFPPKAAPPSSFMARMQEKCNIATWRLQTGYLEPESPGGAIPPHPSSPYWSGSSPASPTTTKRQSTELDLNSKPTEDTETKARKGFRMINAVPAFAVPLTRILSPVIVRGQWEIVVRSAFVGLLVSWILLGSLLAVPPVR